MNAYTGLEHLSFLSPAPSGRPPPQAGEENEGLVEHERKWLLL